MLSAYSDTFHALLSLIDEKELWSGEEFFVKSERSSGPKSCNWNREKFTSIYIKNDFLKKIELSAWFEIENKYDDNDEPLGTRLHLWTCSPCTWQIAFEERIVHLTGLWQNFTWMLKHNEDVVRGL